MILVTGANGFVGSSIVTELANNNHHVVALTRATSRSSIEHHNVVHRYITQWTPQELTKVLTDVNIVIHAASVVHKPGSSLEEYNQFNIQGTKDLIETCLQHSIKRIVFLSSIKVYGERPNGIITESTPTLPDGPYSASKLTAETLIATSPIASTQIRLCPVYGPGDKGNVRAMIRAIARRFFFLPGDGSVKKSIVHSTTVSQAVRKVIESNAPTVNGTFVLSDRVAPSMQELAYTIARALNVRKPLHIPVPLLHAAAWTSEHAFSLLGRQSPVTRSAVQKTLIPTVCSPAKIEQALNIHCHVDLFNTILDEIQWMRSLNLL